MKRVSLVMKVVVKLQETVRLPDREWVREVIYGDGPPPSGLDPEMIAAARRIARRLNGK